MVSVPPESQVFDSKAQDVCVATPRRLIPIQAPEFFDEVAVEKELRRVFDICNGCRRCFNLCGLFPKLFAVLDSPEVDADVNKLTSEHMAQIIPSCTLCDMCYLPKCPYVPPHPWKVDFPRLILRYRAIQTRKKVSLKKNYARALTKTMANVDAYAPLASALAPVVNRGLECGCLRKVGQAITGVDARARIPKYRKALMKTYRPSPPNGKGPLYGEEVWLSLTCFMNYNQNQTAQASVQFLTALGIKVHMVYAGCCGMPLWEQGHLDKVVEKCKTVVGKLAHAKTVVVLTPSCTLMMTSEWPALAPEDANVRALADRTYDLGDYCLKVARQAGLEKSLDLKDVAVHMACHVRAQHKGNASYGLLSYLSKTPVTLVERCSGHGGIWGYMQEHFDQAITQGQATLKETGRVSTVVTECPLAQEHLSQAADMAQKPISVVHPLVLIAQQIHDEFNKEKILPEAKE